MVMREAIWSRDQSEGEWTIFWKTGYEKSSLGDRGQDSCGTFPVIHASAPSRATIHILDKYTPVVVNECGLRIPTSRGKGTSLQRDNWG